MKPLVLLGGGEHARSVAWAAASRRTGWLVGLLDPDTAARTVELTAVPRLGGDEKLADLAPTHEFVLGLGAATVSALRGRLVEKAIAAGARFAAVIHASAHVAPSAIIEPGAVVLAGAIVGPGARIGAHAVVNTGAVVEHDCVVEELAQVSPGAVLGGGVTIGREAFVGLGARVRDHIAIGARALIGMGAVVIAPVAAASIVMGVPARQRGTLGDA